MKSAGETIPERERYEKDDRQTDWWNPRNQNRSEDDQNTRKSRTQPNRSEYEFRNWFASEEPIEESDISEDNLDTEENDWNEVNRIEKNKLKQKKRKERNSKKKAELSKKMQHIIGLGPIVESSINYFYKKTKNRKMAEKSAVQEFLTHNLDFNSEELRQMDITDTKTAMKDDVIYVALGNKKHTREIFYRKAMSQNDDLIARDYIPPQLHERFTAIAKRAAELRGENKELKTQLRWGENDLEMFVKIKNTEENLKKVDLHEFMGTANLPDINLSIKWDKESMGLQRRKLNFEKKLIPLPSLVDKLLRQDGKASSKATLTRKNSKEASELEQAKRIRKFPRFQSDQMDTTEVPSKEKSDSEEDI